MVDRKEKLTKRECQVLAELIKSGRVSDQEIARKLNTSRPTVLKIRRRLEQKGVIKKYTCEVDWEKLGLNIHAAILYQWKDYSKSKELNSLVRFIKSQPEVILFVKGEGIGSKTDLIISIHESLDACERFIKRLKYQWRDNVENVEVFLSSIRGIFKNYDLSSPALCRIGKREDDKEEKQF